VLTGKSDQIPGALTVLTACSAAGPEASGRKGQMMDKLAELIDQFRAEVDYPGGIRPRRDAERAELAPALSRNGLDDPDAQLLR